MFFKQSEIIDLSAKAYAERVDSGLKTYPLNPQRKATLKKEFAEELEK